jgi:uncharacterized lipoprotein YmbA
MKWVVLILILSLTSCSTSPEPQFYGLSEIDGTQTKQNFSIKIQRPSLSQYLDRPDIVRSENTYQYKIDEMHRWAEPLDQMFERVLTEDLQQRSPNGKILSESDTGTIDLRYIVETNIAQFNEIDDERISLKLQFSITDRTKAQNFTPQYMEMLLPFDGTNDGLAAALSKLVGFYADRIVSALGNAPKS